jgi:ubiquinone/menaquinone biosynthesis C-methylase UbiE
LQKFSGKAGNYEAGRPSYAPEAVDYILSQFGPSPAVADVGAGTGKFSVLLAQRNVQLYAVEPNEDMRQSLEKTLAPYPSAKARNGTAEATGLEDSSVDIVVCAQAFHWFDHEAIKPEFNRILKNGGKAFIVYNEKADRQDFMEELAWFTRINDPSHAWPVRKEAISKFFSRQETAVEFPNPLVFDRETYLAFMLSHSMSPNEDEPEYDRFCESVLAAFDQKSIDGAVVDARVTCVYTGPLC